MNEIKLFAPCPFLEDIVDLNDAIRWHPGDWRREEVYSSDSCIREHISDIASNYELLTLSCSVEIRRTWPKCPFLFQYRGPVGGVPGRLRWASETEDYLDPNLR